MKAPLSLLVLALGLALGGCGPGGMVACTLIGCEDGLSLTIENPPPQLQRVELALPDGRVHAVDCAQPEHCASPFLFVPHVRATEATVRIVAPGGTREVQIAPSYQPQYPNGRRCGAACTQARVTIRL